MKKIKPYYSLILIPDEKFRAKYKFNEIEKSLTKIREHIISFDKRLKRIYSLKMISAIFSANEKKKKSPLLIFYFL